MATCNTHPFSNTTDLSFDVEHLNVSSVVAGTLVIHAWAYEWYEYYRSPHVPFTVTHQSHQAAPLFTIDVLLYIVLVFPPTGNSGEMSLYYSDSPELSLDDLESQECGQCSPDDDLSAIQKLERYLNSENVYSRYLLCLCSTIYLYFFLANHYLMDCLYNKY